MRLSAIRPRRLVLRRAAGSRSADVAHRPFAAGCSMACGSLPMRPALRTPMSCSDVLLCRSEQPIPDSGRRKISLFYLTCPSAPSSACRTLDVLYRIPMALSTSALTLNGCSST